MSKSLRTSVLVTNGSCCITWVYPEGGGALSEVFKLFSRRLYQIFPKFYLIHCRGGFRGGFWGIILIFGEKKFNLAGLILSAPPLWLHPRCFMSNMTQFLKIHQLPSKYQLLYCKAQIKAPQFEIAQHKKCMHKS